MRKALISALGLLACGVAAPALAQAQAAPPQASFEQQMAAANARPDSVGTGPYAARKLVEPAIPQHVVYRPADLAALKGKKLGVLIWGNGGCSDDGASARQHLLEIASHGYLVIAPGTIRSGPGAPPQPPRPAPTPGAPPQLGIKTSSDDVRAGLDWALAENGRAGSPYYGKIDPAQTAVAGHSCGGLQALQLAADPRIHAVIVHNSGVFTDGTNPIAGLSVNKALLETLRTPVLYILGGKTDIAYPNGTDDYARITKVPAVLANIDIGHGGSFGAPNGGVVAPVAVAWLQWQLRGDATAGKMFTGAECGLCTDPKWTVERKGIQ